jgi:hypothetical protein
MVLDNEVKRNVMDAFKPSEADRVNGARFCIGRDQRSE